MNSTMPRISWVRGVQSLHRASSAVSRRTVAVGAGAFATRPISTTPAPRSTNIPEDSALTRLPPTPALDNKDTSDRRPLAVRLSRLPFPASRNEAATPKEVSAADPVYEPATSLDDLAEAGTLSEWWDQPGHWSELDQFTAFASADKVTDKAAIAVYYRRALVEVLALQETGALGEWATKKWAEGSREDMNAALAVEIVAQEGGAVLKGEVAAVANSLKQVSDVSEVVTRPERISSEDAAEMIKTWDSSWKDIAVNDQMKFALRKRLYQLTGNMIPDAKLGAATTVGQLITLTAKQPKPQRLAEILQKTEELQRLANVKLHDRRVSSIDREVAVGRWKLIEAELVKRDLPITGQPDVSRNREREHLLGTI